MKKKVKKLELNKETVRNLTSDDLKKIAGGSDVSVPRTICNSCRPIVCP
jgi:natural product precursor